MVAKGGFNFFLRAIHAGRIALRKVLDIDNRGQGRGPNLSLLFRINAFFKTLSAPMLIFFLDVVLSGISMFFSQSA
jgi:hypothetical protein